MPDTYDSLNTDDPYSGYASSPDKCREYNLSSKENQKIWITRSENIIREFILKLSTFKNFYEAYAYLANKRHDVAVELNQKADEDKTDNYGLFRQEGEHFRKSISAGDGEQFWKWQKKKIFELTYDLIKPIKNESKSGSKKTYFIEDEYKTCLREEVTVEGMHAAYYSITVKFPFNDSFKGIDHTDTLSSIELYHFHENARLDLIRIEYTPVNNINVKGHYQIADYYYQKLLDWNDNEPVENFLSNAAKLSYLVAHLLPVKNGNSAIMEWMIRGLAFNNGLDMGYFNHSLGISWDFKAILTPNLNDYIKWYSEKLFLDWSLFNKHTDSALFAFHKQIV